MHLQLCCKEPAHFVAMVRVTLDVVVHLLLAVLPFAWTDGRRACSHVGHGAGQRGYPGVTCRGRATFTSYSGVLSFSDVTDNLSRWKTIDTAFQGVEKDRYARGK